MISFLTLSYNKARQASITKELLEVTTGAEALRFAKQKK
jgi:F0F1-type ATP synthase gamma subunit